MLFSRAMWHGKNKTAGLLLLLFVAVSCTTAERSSSLIEEDKLYTTRIYIGNYIGYRFTPSDDNGNPDLIWISTTRDSIHGKISAHGRECIFAPGDRLYINRILTTNGKSESWLYRIENSDSVSYRVNEYRSHNKHLVGNWLNDINNSSLAPDTVSWD
jgi:hypothetical protein